MTNQKELEKYLVGDKGYLRSDISDNKIIMISGKWGSGKTYFWKEQIQKDLIENEKPNHYISLYGKTSIQEIKNEIFLKVFESINSFETKNTKIEKAKNIAKSVTSIASTVSLFGVSLDLIKLVDKSFESLDKEKEEKIKEYLNSGAIICFDDFERKSKDIDLNDLFGFITQLTMDFKCKVVIILNDDIFEGEDKKIFSNVKEKSVSKYLKYEPTIEELFEIIFNTNDYNDKLGKNYKNITLQTIKETGELNARIYIQVLDNLKEWMEKNQKLDDNILKCLILVNINFILYHTILNKIPLNLARSGVASYKDMRNGTAPQKLAKKICPYLIDKIAIKNYDFYYKDFNFNSFSEYKINLENEITRKNFSDEKFRTEIKFIEDNILLFKSIYFANKLDIAKNVDDETFKKINSFIETGIII